MPHKNTIFEESGIFRWYLRHFYYYVKVRLSYFFSHWSFLLIGYVCIMCIYDTYTHIFWRTWLMDQVTSSSPRCNCNCLFPFTQGRCQKERVGIFPNQMSRSSGVAKGQKLVCPMSSSTFSYIVTPKRLTNTGVHNFPLIHMYTSSALVGASISSFGTYGFPFFLLMHRRCSSSGWPKHCWWCTCLL